MFGRFLRVTYIILLSLLVIACGGGSDNADGDTNVTPSNLTVFLAPEGRQYANKRWRRFSTDVLLPSAKQWEVEVTGDIELFSKLPSYSGTDRSFVGHFRMEIAPDFEDPQDANLDNVYEVDLTAYVPNTQPRQIVANAKINFIISNENNSTWQDNGLRFITSPIQRLDYLNLGNELLQTSARHRFSMLTPTRMIDDIDGGWQPILCSQFQVVDFFKEGATECLSYDQSHKLYVENGLKLLTVRCPTSQYRHREKY